MFQSILTKSKEYSMMKMLRFFSVLALMLGFSITLAAQDRTVTGRVTSAEDGSAIPGVNVLVKGTTTGTTTGSDGRYSIAAPANATLVFSFIGLVPVEVAVGNRSVVDVQMASDVKALQEVVVTAFGIEREKKALTYAAQVVSGERVAAAGQPNLTNALQGKAAGVIVRQSSGMPGASSQITIRGSRSLDGNNQPLYVVDGMPIESGPAFAGGVSGTDASSRALDINPEDIESVNILKGPSASALYGLRAANGVVVITTKRGRNAAKGRPNVSFSTNYTVDEVSRTPEIQSTYAQGSAGRLQQGTSFSWGPRIDTLQPFMRSVTGLPAELVQPKVYDNVSPFFKKGGTLNTAVDVSGATENGNYAVGLGYTTQEGFVPTTGMRRVNAKLAGDFQIAPKVKVGASANYSDLNVDKIAGGSNLSNPLFTTYYAPRTYDLWGLPFAFPDNPYRQIHYRAAMDNPRWSLANNTFNEKTRRFFGNANATYSPLDWLSFNYRLGVDYFVTDGKEVYELGSGNTGGRTAVPSGGQVQNFSVAQNQVNSNFNININKQFGEDFNFGLLLGNELYDIRERRMTMTGTGIAVGGFPNVGVTTTQTTSEINNNSRVVGFFANLSLAWKDMLFLNASGRNDYVSNMPRGNRSFFYPSVGLGFAFTEAFNIAENILSFGKLRASAAQVGQAGPLYSTRNIFVQGRPGSGFLTDDLQFPFNGLVGYTQSNIIRSPALVPQNVNTVEAGIDLRFLRDRLSVEYTYYIINSTDQIFEVPIASSTGFTSELRNAGELKTTGHELAITGTPVKVGGFDWTVNANFTSYDNRVVSLAEGVDNIFLGGFVTPNVRAYAGAVYPAIFGSRYLRDPNTGKIVVESREGSPYYGMPLADPKNGVIGNVQPDFEIGFTNTFTFKGLSLSAQIDWRKGGDMYAGNTRLAKLYGMDKVTEDRATPTVLDAVKGYLDDDGNLVVEGANDIAILKDQTYWSQVLDVIEESNVYSTSFVRLREVTLGYNLPAAWTKKVGFRGVNVFLTGRNLFLITDYPNFDPETSTGGAGNFQGLEYVALPQIRSYGAGLRVSL